MQKWTGTGAIAMSEQDRLSPVHYNLQKYDAPDRCGYAGGGFLNIPASGTVFMLRVMGSGGKVILEMEDGASITIGIDIWNQVATGIKFHAEGPLPP